MRGPGITLAQAAERYLTTKARTCTIEADRRQLELLKAEFGAETRLAEITTGRISDYKTRAQTRRGDLGWLKTIALFRQTANGSWAPPIPPGQQHVLPLARRTLVHTTGMVTRSHMSRGESDG
jgi:hypothetical protein